MARLRNKIDTQHWRRREAEARLIALSMRNPDAKRVLLAIANGYKRLAEREAAKAEKLIDGVSFGPDALKVVGAAFDAAWGDIADNFRSEPSEIEAARRKLAGALLSIATEDSRNVEALRKAALIRMAASVATGAFVSRFATARVCGPIEWRGGLGFRAPASLPLVTA